jgi:hypothetical protein
MKNITQYTAIRAGLIARIRRDLAGDPRFLAAWLAGSFGRGEEDSFSDLDLHLVVADPQAATLCARPRMAGAGTTPERLALFGRFGKPALVHENNHNAPPGGTFTFVLYAGSALMVDWVLVPAAGARRPAETVLLFDHAGIPALPAPAPEAPAERAEKAAEQLAFFWMMAAITAKYLLRRDGGMVQWLLEMLARTLAEVDRLATGEPPLHRRGAYAELAATHTQQRQALREFMEAAEQRAPRLQALGGPVPQDPKATVAVLLGLLEDS